MKLAAGCAAAVLIFLPLIVAAPINSIIASHTSAEFDISAAKRRDSNARFEHNTSGWNDRPVHDWKRALDHLPDDEADHKLKSAVPKPGTTHDADHDLDKLPKMEALWLRSPRWWRDRGWNNRPGQDWKREAAVEYGSEPDVHGQSGSGNNPEPSVKRDADARAGRGWNENPGQDW